ncbi:MAG: hypothetical protein A2075_11050 [Geobacteraceae bacterium GWC2_58_44]|nr:MAG: hypothetical protein A2075_11050 [Geobacteraceae bacterium GWC2_58_44]HBG07990.1 hypothetical protein [Geobacter sp.]
MNANNSQLLIKPLIILAAVVAGYSNSVWGDFQFSDYNVIVSNPAVHSWGGWLETMRHLGIRPLLKFTYTLCWTSGLGVAGFHLFNIAVHALSSLFVYLLAGRFTRRCAGLERKGGDAAAAFFIGLLFALHPVHTEAVTYICARSASLSALLYLGSLLAYLRGVETRKPVWLFIASPLLFVAAVATKEVAVTLPLALLLWEATVGRRSWKRALADQSVHWALLLLLMVVIFSHPRYLTLLLFSSELRSFSDNMVSQINGIGYLLSRLVLLNKLNIDPDIQIVTSMNPVLWCKLAVGAAALGIAVRLRRSRPWLIFGAVWFFLVLMPSNSVFARLDLVNERHLYLADFGLLLALGCEIGLLYQRRPAWRTMIAGAAGAVCCLLLLFTMLRNRDYRSEVSLWESTTRQSPQKARGFNNLGCAYELAKLPEQAAACYAKALQLDPRHQNARANLERLQMAGGEPGSPSLREMDR